ncbi:MAG: S-layer homology domain-containing protein [Bacillota bacterium]
MESIKNNCMCNWVLRTLILCVAMVLVAPVLTWATDLKLQWNENDQSLSLQNVSSNVIGVKVELPVTGNATDVGFALANPDHEGFLVGSESAMTIYVASDVDLRDDTTIALGVLTGTDGIAFGGFAEIEMTNFLFQSTQVKDVPLVIVQSDGSGSGNVDSDGDSDIDGDGDGDSDVDVDVDVDSDSDSDGDVDSDVDVDSDSDGDGDSDGDVDSDGDTDTDSNTNTDSNSNSGSSSSSSSGSSSTEGEVETEEEETEEEETESTETINQAEAYREILETYTDIGTHWASEHIAFVIAEGLFAGTSDTEFSPDNQMTRAMFVTVLGRIDGAELPKTTTPFADVGQNTWYTDSVGWAVSQGITSGTSATTFAPNNNVTREQMAVFLQNYVKAFDLTLPVVEDMEIFADDLEMSGWAKEAVYVMQQADIINGKGSGNFDPKGLATRAEVATMIRKFVEVCL